MIETYPLCWPVDYKRSSGSRRKSTFKNTLGNARDMLKIEVKRLGGSDLIISSNIPTRNDGELRADFGRYKLDDPGVAIYFKWKKRDIVMCCDTYLAVWENIVALCKAIEALRGLERWGVSEFLDRAFTGFNALPPASGIIMGYNKRKWWDVLQVRSDSSRDMIVSSYRSLVKTCHPDVPGTGDMIKFQEIQEAYEEAIK